jgi:hypothetical protein
VRIACFLADFPCQSGAGLLADLDGGRSATARQLAAVVQQLGVDVLLLAGIDAAEADGIATVLARQYFAESQDAAMPLEFEHRCVLGPTALVAAEAGAAALAGTDRAMVLFARWPIERERIRSFLQLRWSQMPSALRPAQDCPDEVWAKLPLSAAGHWDVPLRWGDDAAASVVHLLCAQPTSPRAASAGDLASRRNHDEVRFWNDYLSSDRSAWIVDDAGLAGGLAATERCVVVGSLQCDPVDGYGPKEALAALLAHPRLQDPRPGSAGAVEQHQLQWGSNARHRGDPALDTADLDDHPETGPGNLRLDYVLPTRALKVVRSGVFWPVARDPAVRLIANTRHRVVWVDVVLP